MSIIENIPSNHWSTFFKPTNLPFFIFPFDTAFALNWWLKAFFLLIGVYAFIFNLTKRNYLLAIGGSLFMFFTPFVQWWYSAQVPETFGYFFLSLFAFTELVRAQSKLKLWFFTIIFTYFILCLVFILYIPFVLPLILLEGFFTLGYYFNLKKKPRKLLLMVFPLVATIIISILGLFYFDFSEVIKIIAGTDYPGKRVILGGGYNLLRFLFGFFGPFLQKSGSVPAALGNQSELSTAIFFFPFLLPIIAINYFRKKEKVDFIIVSLFCFISLILIWIFIGFPQNIAHLLQFDKILHQRIVIGVIAANLILVFYYLSLKRSILNRKFIIFLSLLAWLIHLYLGIEIIHYYPTIFNNIFIAVIISFLAFFLVYFLLSKQQKTFTILLVSYSIFSTFIINPLYRSLDPLTKTSFAQEVKEINLVEADALWLVYDKALLANYIIANGIKTVNGTHMYPQKDLMEKFDKSNKFVPLWNRYAHITFENNLDLEKINMLLTSTDALTVQINPCNSLIGQLDVKYVVFITKKNSSCLEIVKEFYTQNFPIYIYKRLNN